MYFIIKFYILCYCDIVILLFKTQGLFWQDPCLFQDVSSKLTDKMVLVKLKFDVLMLVKETNLTALFPNLKI